MPGSYIQGAKGATQGSTLPSNYYGDATKYGEYAFVSLQEIIDNFVATYVGTGKILQGTHKGDVQFHAHRALQELSYDTFKSYKSQEIELCSNLKMPLPHDYVNYVKLTWVDNKGIERIIYPASKTSNPFAISQNPDNCTTSGDSSDTYEYTDGELKEQAINCTTGTCDPVTINYPEAGGLLQTPQTWNSIATDSWTTLKTDGYVNATYVNQALTAQQAINDYCACLDGLPDSVSTLTCGEYIGWDNFTGACWMQLTNNQVPAANLCTLPFKGNYFATIFNAANTFAGPFAGSTYNCESGSDTWSAFSDSTGNTIASDSSLSTNPSVDADNYFLNEGKRYGIDPQYAQANGSYYIDELRGVIHFSSNLASKTITLKYISDGHGNDSENVVPKLAEEAIYKWIAYGCLSAKIGIPENVIQRYKREKFAETRKAKIRLSNIKIEEISQIMRGKSKFIKH